MKRIGYIYKYSELEKKGILVYGRWKVYELFDSYRTSDVPLLFYDYNCITKVATGQLVYFELEESKPTNIERATLANFRKEVIDALLTQEYDLFYKCLSDNTHIVFENLNDIYVPKTEAEKILKKYKVYEESRATIEKTNNRRKRPSVSHSYMLSKYTKIVDDMYEKDKYNPGLVIYSEDEHLKPNNIDDLFDCFNKYRHKKDWVSDQLDSKTINIMDISFWIDEEICKHKCYGEKTEELIYLYDVFIGKQIINEKDGAKTIKREKGCFSKLWKLLLAKMPDYELEKTIQEIPIVQPNLPIQFCKEHLNILREEYGMPSVDVCKLYCNYRIENTNTASEYQHLSNRLYAYEHCCAEHSEEDGVPFCKMGQKTIIGLRGQLEKRYNIIKNNVIQQFNLYTSIEDERLLNETEFNKDQLLSIEKFFKTLKYFSNDLTYSEAFIIEYAAIPIVCQNILKESIHKLINTHIIDFAKDENTSPSLLSYVERQLSEWIDDGIKNKIVEIVNSRFAGLDGLSDLYDAYIGGYISVKQYFLQYQNLTSNYNTYQLVKELDNFHYGLLPRPIQWNIVSRIIKSLDYKSLDSQSNIDIGYYESISNVRDLLRWIEHKSNIDNIIKEKAKKRILNVLSNEEKWKLFEERIISSPGMEIIRERLDKAYKDNYSLKNKIFRTNCFQEVMYHDILTCDDNNKKLRILDYLYGDYRIEILHQTDKLIQLYFWLRNPDETKDWDWDFITTHFADFHERDQIILLRYIFFLIAQKKVSTTIDELYNIFVDSSKSICSIVSCVIYLLKEKIENPNKPIRSDVFFSIFANYHFDSLKNYFYICNGYYTFTYLSNDTKDLSFMGYIEKKLINNEYSYVITFYEEPQDFWGEPIEWLSDKEIEIAKSVLEINLNAKKFDDDEYIIPLSEINELKKYVLAYNIEDKCNLFNIGSYKLYYPYMLYNKKYTPNRDAYLKIFNNKKRSYERCHNFICCCSNYCDIDPEIGIPFYWCNKKTCTRNCIFIKPVSLWQKFKIADFLYILFGMNKSNIPLIWSIVAELSQFINDFINLYEEDEWVDFKKNIVESKIVRKNEEVGLWSKNMSIIKEVDDSIDEYYYHYDDDDDIIYFEEDLLDGLDFGNYIDEGEDDDDEHDDDYYDYRTDDYIDPQTYDRYNGSYAQDVMGYSDDDIDTIFDGDPDAYWNID